MLSSPPSISESITKSALSGSMKRRKAAKPLKNVHQESPTENKSVCRNSDDEEVQNESEEESVLTVPKSSFSKHDIKIIKKNTPIAASKIQEQE